MKKCLLFVIVAGILALPACTWVKITPAGEAVHLVSSGDVGNCTKVGRTTVSVLAKVGFADRDKKRVADELLTLGRNSAADMGGDSIVAVSGVKDGEQKFDVYRCK